MTGQILAIDQGTTSTRAILFGPDLVPAAQSQQEFPQYFPQSGWVEHDPEDLWRTTVETCRVAASGAAPAAIGITNQRETAVVWERETGKPIHPAIVWQDRRTSGTCARLKEEGCEPMVTERSGLLLDPYFSATKFSWLLDQVEGARDAAESGRLLAGTVDSWLLWRLTDGAVHATDATNASRTMLYNIHAGGWDPELCRLFRVPSSILPDVRDCAAEFGMTSSSLFGRPVPIRGIAGDQQAASIGQACFRPGMMKSTYGTGCFALLNTGKEPVSSSNRLLTTIAYRFDGEPAYALEGSIFVAGAVVQWLRDGLGLIGDASESGRLAAQSGTGSGVVLVPAFVGLGAPYWDAECRGAVYGLTRATGPSRSCVGGAAERRIPDARSCRGDAGRLEGRRGYGPAGRRRNDRVRLDHAVSCRHPGRARGPAGGAGDDGGRGRLACGDEIRDLPRPRSLFRELGARAALSAAHGGGRANDALCRLEGCGSTNPDCLRAAGGRRSRLRHHRSAGWVAARFRALPVRSEGAARLCPPPVG